MPTNTKDRPQRSAAFQLLSQVAVLAALVLAIPSHAFAQSAESGATGGVSALWIFSNLSFTGMRAQGRGDTFWRIVSFIFGFPGTLLTLIVVKPGSQRAYGIDMPRRAG
jgi:hypothetical protein